MWNRREDDNTLWMDITARERHFTISLFGQRKGVIAKDTQILDEETARNLHDALGDITDPNRSAPPEAFRHFGALLFALGLPEAIQVELLKHAGPLVFSTHELSLPWEMLIVNGRYLCLQQSVSRQLPVLTAMQKALLGDQPAIDSGNSGEDAVLIIANPTGDLKSAAHEAEELRDFFCHAGLRCDALIGPKACTYANVLGAHLQQHAYRIIHIAGHAEFLEHKGTSAIHLAEGRMILAQEIQRTFQGEPLVFLNACWSAMGEGGKRRGTPSGCSGSNVVQTLAEAFTFGNRSGRARAIVGSMWWIADDVARGLAGHFYQDVLTGLPLGDALRNARQRVSKNMADPALWCSYVLFGDPHQCVVKTDKPIEIAPPPLPPPIEPPVAVTTAQAELPWSDEMRAAFVGAMAAMAAMHWRTFSTIHLILGLTYLENGLVAKAMIRSGVNPQLARRTLREAFTIKGSDQSQNDSIISKNLTGVLETAQQSAWSNGAAEVSEADVVWALLDRPESGGTMLLGCLKVDLDDLRQRLTHPPGESDLKPDGKVSPANDEQPAPVVTPPVHGDLMLPNGELHLALFDEEALSALKEAALIAYRTYWADLRSPHVFLGLLGRRNSRLAQYLLAIKLVDPNALSGALQAALTQPVDVSLRQPKLHREFLSENALSTLRAASGIAVRSGRQLIAEHDILSAILQNESNIITTTLRKIGIDPARLLWLGT